MILATSVFWLCLAGMVDVVFADVAQPDQARIVSLNAQSFLKNQGHFIISIKVSGCGYVQICLLQGPGSWHKEGRSLEN